MRGFSRASLAGAALLIVLAVIAVTAPWLAPHDPLRTHLPDALLGPSAMYPLGTDQLGRDVLSRLMYGARISLSIGFIAVGISVLIGVAVGGAAGFAGGG